MPLILGILGLLFPRLLIIILWLVTTWFSRVFDNLIILILGLIFLPLTTLWYAIVVHYFGGVWSALPIAGMVVALVIDLGGLRSTRRWW